MTNTQILDEKTSTRGQAPMSELSGLSIQLEGEVALYQSALAGEHRQRYHALSRAYQDLSIGAVAAYLRGESLVAWDRELDQLRAALRELSALAWE